MPRKNTPPKVTPHGNKFAIEYRISGYTKLVHESFDTEDEAETRALQVALLKRTGLLTPPQETKNPLVRSALEAEAKAMTLQGLMTAYIEGQGPSMEAGCLGTTEGRINNYIIPQIGDVPVSELSVPLLNKFYDDLSETIICEQKGKQPHTIGESTIKKCKADIRAAINWGIANSLITEAYNVASHSKTPAERAKKQRSREETADAFISWDYEQFFYALDVCKDKMLRFVILMMVMCSMRIGELLALDWKHARAMVDGVQNQIQRAKEEHLNRSTKTKAYFVFPKQHEDSESVVFFTDPKEDKTRHVPYGKGVSDALDEWERRQELEKQLIGADYTDYGLVVAQPNGRPYESETVLKRLVKFCKEAGLPCITTHSLRHTSIDLKLEVSGGNIREVMADSGHSTDKMVTMQYASMRERRRKTMADRMDSLLTNREMPNSPIDK